MIKPQTSVLIDITRKGSRSLQRDYFELENLQNSAKSLSMFSQKAGQQAFKKMHEAIVKYYPQMRIFTSLDDLHTEDFSGHAMLLSPLEGVRNFERALPFFATTISLLKKIKGKIITEQIVLNFPALGDIYYAEFNKGAFVDDHSSNFAGSAVRIKVSSRSQVSDALVIANSSSFDLARKMSDNVRIFESSAYGASMVARGKSDICVLNGSSPSRYAFELLINEAGGYVTQSDGVLYGVNGLLYGKI